MRPKISYDRASYDQLLIELDDRACAFEAVIDRLEEDLGWELYRDNEIEGVGLVLESVEDPEKKLRILTYFKAHEGEYRKYYSFFSNWGCGEDGRYVWGWSREGYMEDRVLGAPTLEAEYEPLADFLQNSRVSADPFMEWEARRQLWSKGSYWAMHAGALAVEEEWQTP